MPSKKHYPVIRKLTVGATAAPVNLNGIIDIPQLMSQVNHRLYRQSRVYEASVTIDADLADATTIEVFALADSWWTMKALQLAKAAWDESNAEELAMLGGKKARWSDFRVLHGVDSPEALVARQFASNMNPVQFTAGEFTPSRVVDQAGVTREFTWANVPAADEYSIYAEYDRSGNTNVDPTTPATGPYTGLLPNLETDAAAALQQVGNEPPYNATQYPSGIWVKIGTLHLGAGRQRLSTGFFNAPCGLVVLKNYGTAGIGNLDVQVEVKKGDYKGISAKSMLE